MEIDLRRPQVQTPEVWSCVICCVLKIKINQCYTQYNIGQFLKLKLTNVILNTQLIVTNTELILKTQQIQYRTDFEYETSLTRHD